MKRILLLTLSLLAINEYTAALQRNNDSIIICGRWPSAAGQPQIFLVGNYQMAVPVTQKERPLKMELSADSFYVSVPVKERFAYFRFRNLVPFRNVNNYLLQRGDSIHIDGTGRKNNSILLTCQLKLDSIYFLNPLTGRDTLTYSRRMLARAGRNFQKGRHLLQQYGSSIEHHLLAVMELNFYLRTHSIFYAVWKRNGLADKDKYDPVWVLRSLVQDKRLQVREQVWEASDKYIEYRTFLLMGYFELLSERKELAGSPYRHAYEYVQKTCSGRLKDRISSYLLVRSIQRDPEIILLLPEAIAALTDTLAKQTLTDAYNSVKPGKRAFYFDLPDEKGVRHCLADYRGKAVVMKFWFTGCTGCAEIRDNMEIVERTYSGNDDIIFFNVNMSKKKDVWLAGLASGKYTNAGEINLYTNGAGIEHPLVKHYQFGTAPQLLLIDKKGNVYSGNPPLPYTEQQTKALIRMIDKMRS